MGKLLLFITFSFVIGTQVWASDFRNRVELLLPKDLTNLDSKMSRSQLEKSFSKSITKKTHDSLFLKVGSNRTSDVTIGTKSGNFSYLYIDAGSNIVKKDQSLFNEIWDSLDKKRRDKILKSMEQDTGHDQGRYIVVDLPEYAMTLKFDSDEKKELSSIILYPKGKK